MPVVLFGCSSGPATCAANTNVNVTGGTLTYTANANELSSLGVKVSAISPASKTSNGGFHLPISSGTTVNNSSVAGTINTKGGIKFTGPTGHSLSLTNFSVNTKTGQVTAQANGTTTHFLQLHLSTATKSSSSSQINLSGVTTTLSSAGAVVFDRGLAITTFTPAVQLGTFTAGVTYSCP